MHRPIIIYLIAALSILFALTSCGQKDHDKGVEEAQNVVNPEDWPAIKPLPLNPSIEAQIDSILPKLTLQQKVGQVI